MAERDNAEVFRQPGAVGDPGMCGSSLFGNREISSAHPGRLRRRIASREGEEP